LVATTIAASTLVLGSGIAHAAAPSGTGWDDVNDSIVGSGSDTTFNFMQRSDVLYNQAQGCETNNTFSSAVGNTYGQCLTAGTANATTLTTGNWDHDYATEKYPTGSGAGRSELLAGSVDFARSSASASAPDLSFWGYAKDGLAIITLGTRASGDLSKAQIQSIWNCSVTDWGTLLTGTPNGETIEPVGMNASSGTKATFQAYLGFDPNAGTCVKKLSSGIFPFENDVKPIVNDTVINEDNAIWWMSYGEYRAFSYKRGSAKVWSVGGVDVSAATVANDSYVGLTRFLYHVTKKTAAVPASTTVGAAYDVVGATAVGSGTYTADTTGTVADGGRAGAVREYTRFICKPQASHSANDFTGLSNYAEYTAIFNATGFIRVPSAQRTPGAGLCKYVAG
jgi:ABC-type phosphate transport system substrate-binding protein